MEESFFYNWEAGLENPILFDGHSEVTDALFGLLDPADSALLPLDTLFQKDMDSLISSSSLPLSSATNGEEGGNFLPLPSFTDSSILNDNSFSLHRSPKRHCSCTDLYIQEQPPPLFEPSPFYYSIVDPTVLAGFETPLPPTMAAVTPITYSGSNLSSQSVAARERRKRISEKTQELGRLIPGGSKMNTADMLQAGLKYVEFLQAQIGIMRLMDSIPGCKSGKEEGHLEVLLASTAIQERLSADGLCIVPKEMVDELASDTQLSSTPLISGSMDLFIESTVKMDDSK